MKDKEFKLRCTKEQKTNIINLIAQNSVIDDKKQEVAEVIIRALEKLKEER